MTDRYTQTIQIEGPYQNAVENFIHEIKKQADDAKRFGVDITITRVDVSDKEVEFDD